MRIIITHVYVCPKQVVLREKWHSSLLVKIAKHKLTTVDMIHHFFITVILCVTKEKFPFLNGQLFLES